MYKCIWTKDHTKHTREVAHASYQSSLIHTIYIYFFFWESGCPTLFQFESRQRYTLQTHSHMRHACVCCCSMSWLIILLFSNLFWTGQGQYDSSCSYESKAHYKMLCMFVNVNWNKVKWSLHRSKYSKMATLLVTQLWSLTTEIIYMLTISNGISLVRATRIISAPWTGPASLYDGMMMSDGFLVQVTFHCSNIVPFTGSQSREWERSGESLATLALLWHAGADEQCLVNVRCWMAFTWFSLLCTACCIYMLSFVYLTSSCRANVCLIKCWSA